MINLIIEIIVVLASSWLLTKNYFGINLLIDSILVCFILFFAQVVLVLTLLGSINQLYFFNVFIVHLLVLLITLLIFSQKKASGFVKPNVEPFFKHNLILFAVSVFFAFFLVKLYYNLISPPLDCDSLLYHLVFPASWIKSGSLNTPFFIFGSCPIVSPGALETSAPSYYPINAELFFTWLMLPLRNAFLADLGEVPFYFAGMLAFYAILRKYNLNQKIALLSGFLLVLTPNIFKQIKTASQTDFICAVLFILVFFTLLLLKLNFTFKHAILFGITSGLFVGAKFSNVIWLTALLPLTFYIVYRGVKLRKFSGIKIIIFLGCISSMIILFGGYMYIKNYYFTGNPFFPVEFRMFDKVVFKGFVNSATFKMQIFPCGISDLMKLFKEGLGVQFLALTLPCTFLPIFFYRYLKSRVTPFGEYMLVFITPLIALILYKIFIGIYIARYFFPYLSIGLLTGVIFVTKLPRGEKYFMVVSFVSFFVAAFELAHRHELILSLLLSLLFFVVLVIYKKQLISLYKSRILGRVILVMLLLGLLFLVYLYRKYNKEEFDRYPLIFNRNEAWQIDIGKGWHALDELTKEGARVAYTGRQECYPLFGKGTKNEVKYVSINEKEITPYNNPDGRYRQIQDFSAWRENLKRYEVEYLFVAKPVFKNRESVDPDKFPIEDEWANAHAEDFQLLFSNSLTRIYKVLIK